MSVAENKAIVRRIYEEVNKRNLAVMDELIAANCVEHLPGGVEVRGPEGRKQYATTMFTAFPDLHFAIDDMVAEGDKVAVRFTWTGTHKGEYMGIAPTGKQITMPSAFFYRFEGGKEVEAVPYFDMLAMFQQLGVSPPTG